jgi:lipopolysaccharide transport system ATP-binding protein
MKPPLMQPGNAIEVHQLSKRFFVGEMAENTSRRRGLMRRATGPWRRLRSVMQGKSPFGSEGELWALRDVSFTLRQGEVLGVIGANGSGKSTLLKIISRITAPTAGEARVRGAVGSLLEVGTGFHQELTGRENIYFNGAVLGIDKAVINRAYNDIVEFSGVGDFLNTPVKRYSSGMRVRLAFSVAVHLQPEIVLIDEVLSVGDAGFRKHSLDKISKLARDGRTVMLVSHNLQSVQQLCTRAIYLNKGELRMDGPVNQVVERYLNDHLTGVAAGGSADLRDAERESLVISDEVRFTRCALVDESGAEIPAFRYGQPLRFRIEVAARTTVEGLSINLNLFERHGTLIANADSKATDTTWDLARGETREVLLDLRDMRLVPGIYTIGIAIRQHIGMPFDFIRNALSFEILETRDHDDQSPPRVGLFVPTVAWDPAHLGAHAPQPIMIDDGEAVR